MFESAADHYEGIADHEAEQRDATKPSPLDWHNKPWSLPPCPNARWDGTPCTLHAHSVTVINGERVRTHSAQVKASVMYLPLGAARRKRATFTEWQSWQTIDDETS